MSFKYFLRYRPEDDVIVRAVIPEWIEYVPSSTIVYNELHPSGLRIYEYDRLTTTGINIGKYACNGNAFVRFSCILKEKPDIEENPFSVWGQVASSAENHQTIQNSAEVKYVQSTK